MSQVDQLMIDEIKSFERETENHLKMMAIFKFFQKLNFSAKVKAINPFGYCADYSVNFKAESLSQLEELHQLFEAMPLVRLEQGSVGFKPYPYLRDADFNGLGSVIPLLSPYVYKSEPKNPLLMQWWTTCLGDKTLAVSVDVSALKDSIPFEELICDEYTHTRIRSNWVNWASKLQSAQDAVNPPCLINGLAHWNSKWDSLVVKWGCNAKDRAKVDALKTFLMHSPTVLQAENFWNEYASHLRAIKADVFELALDRFTDGHKSEVATLLNELPAAIDGDKALLEIAKAKTIEVLQKHGFYTGANHCTGQFQLQLLRSRLASSLEQKGVSISWLKSSKKNILEIRLQGGQISSASRTFCDFEVKVLSSVALIPEGDEFEVKAPWSPELLASLAARATQ